MLNELSDLKFASKFFTPKVDSIPVAPVGTVCIPK
jgi:hypothetical protein